MAHLVIKALTNEERPGHQKSLSSKTLVQNRPTGPVVGELCMDQTMAWCSCGGMYMQPLKYRWPLVICQSFMDEQGNRGELTFKLSKAQSISGSNSVKD